MEHNIDERIEDLQYEIEKMDGIGKWGVVSRIQGAINITSGAACIYGGSLFNFPINLFPYTIGAILMVEGMGDFLTGKHHHIYCRITKTHPKYELERLLLEKKSELS